MDQLVKKSTIAIERKEFDIARYKNDRGEFLRISEFSNGRRHSIAIPYSGIDAFDKALGEVIDAPKE